MEWTNNHDLALAREVLLLEPYRHKVRTIERGNPLILRLNLFVVTRFGHHLHNANLKVCFSRAEVAVTTYALSNVTAFFKAAASSISRSLLSLPRLRPSYAHSKNATSSFRKFRFFMFTRNTKSALEKNFNSRELRFLVPVFISHEWTEG